MHTNMITGKKYVGITKLKANERWNNGLGYSANRKFYRDIEKYGWDSFSHDILEDNLNYIDAKKKETELINKYNLKENGYNCLNSKSEKTFDYHDFVSLNMKDYKYVNTYNYFTRIPNMFVQNNLSKTFGINRIFLVVFILIDRNRSFEDFSWITIGDVLRLCNYKLTSRKPRIFYEVVKSLLFLKENYFIETNFDYHTINYDDCIKIKIISKNFDATSNFTKLYGKDFDTIMMADSSLNRENILVAFLYINSYIGCRPKQNDGSEYENAKDNPEAFYRSIKHMAEELSMSKDTINQCIEYLTKPSDDISALLIKREVGSVQPDKSKPPKNVPNIYVLNKEGYKQEIEWALNKMIDLYKTEEFYPTKSGNYRFEK